VPIELVGIEWSVRQRSHKAASNADPTKDQTQQQQQQQQPKTISGNKKLDLSKYRGWDSIEVDNDDGGTATGTRY
jgi:hypothetical protein